MELRQPAARAGKLIDVDGEGPGKPAPSAVSRREDLVEELVGDIKDAQRIQQLPLNGRLVANLFDLTPGVEGGANPRVNGMKVGSADMLLDGISFMDRYGGGLRPVQPGLDTIQEFRIETTGSGAQSSSRQRRRSSASKESR